MGFNGGANGHHVSVGGIVRSLLKENIQKDILIKLPCSMHSIPLSILPLISKGRSGLGTLFYSG